MVVVVVVVVDDLDELAVPTVMISMTAMGTLMGCLSDVKIVTRSMSGVKRSMMSRFAYRGL